MNNTAHIQLLNPLALATGFAAAALVVFVVLAVPMQLSMGGAYGGHMPMMGGMGYGMGSWMLLGGATWAIVAGAIAGATVAFTYNAIVKSTTTGQSQPSA